MGLNPIVDPYVFINFLFQNTANQQPFLQKAQRQW